MIKLIPKCQTGKRLFKDGQVTYEKVLIPGLDQYYTTPDGETHRAYQVEDRDIPYDKQQVVFINGQPTPVVSTKNGLEARGQVNFQPEYYIRDAGGEVVVTPKGNRIEYFPEPKESLPWIDEEQLTDESDVDRTIPIGSPTVYDFYKYDVNPRLAKENTFSPDINDIIQGTYIDYKNFNNLNSAGFWDSNFPNKVTLNLDFKLNNGVLAHEFAHRFRQGKLSHYKSYPDEGYSDTEANYLKNAYEGYDDLRYPPIDEKGATNTHVRYRIWKELYDKLGRVPSIQEVDNYINKISDYNLLQILRKANGYGEEYEKNINTREDINEVREALKHVAQNKSNNTQNYG